MLSIAKLDHHNVFVSDTWSLGRVTVNAGVRYDHYQSHVPDQEQIASTTAGFSLPAATFPAETFFTWNSMVPRVGLTYDLRGDGRTVLKANYGYFKHNPGPGAASDGNPNQNSKDRTYTWNDVNGDGLFQFGEQDEVVRDRTGPAGVEIDPDITQPYTHEASAFFEQQLADTLGVRIGYVYKTNDNLTQIYQPFRPISAYTAPFPFLDRGEDGLAGTADDQTLTLFGIPNSVLGPSTQVFQNTAALGRYKTIELSANKRMSSRWSAGAGYNFTWSREHQNSIANNTISSSLGDFPNTPNDAGVHDYTKWAFRIYSTIEGPWGVRLSPVFRHQAGDPYGRYITGVRAPSGLFFSGTVLVEPIGTRRTDNINVLDLKVEKVISLGGRLRVRGFADIFNILNSNAAETISYATGSAFENPTNIIAPRALRIGFRLEW